MSIKCDFTDTRGNIMVGAIIRVEQVRMSKKEILGIGLVYASVIDLENNFHRDKVTIKMPYINKVTGTKNYIKRSYEALLAEGKLKNTSVI